MRNGALTVAIIIKSGCDRAREGGPQGVWEAYDEERETLKAKGTTDRATRTRARERWRGFGF